MAEMLSILVVEDDPAIRQILADALAKRYKPRVAESGEEALQALRESVPDVILTDLDLGGFPGERLAAEALALSRPPIVFMMSGDAPRLLRAAGSAQRTFAKPFPIRDLLSALRECAAKRLN
jgi:two-component system phosphate regulon response regulator PhoB